MGNNIISSPVFLHPVFRTAAVNLSEDLLAGYKSGRTQTLFKIFETFRLPDRQDELFRKGATKARPWQSAHNFGLACDFVPVISPDEANEISITTGERHVAGWSWWSGHDWSYLANRAASFELECNIPWDRCHVQSPRFEALRQLLK